VVLVISSGPPFYVQCTVYCVVLVISSGPPFYVQCTVYCVVFFNVYLLYYPCLCCQSFL
jgi:hypothetical protein